MHAVRLTKQRTTTRTHTQTHTTTQQHETLKEAKRPCRNGTKGPQSPGAAVPATDQRFQTSEDIRCGSPTWTPATLGSNPRCNICKAKRPAPLRGTPGHSTASPTRRLREAEPHQLHQTQGPATASLWPRTRTQACGAAAGSGTKRAVATCPAHSLLCKRRFPLGVLATRWHREQTSDAPRAWRTWGLCNKGCSRRLSTRFLTEGCQGTASRQPPPARTDAVRDDTKRNIPLTFCAMASTAWARYSSNPSKAAPSLAKESAKSLPRATAFIDAGKAHLVETL